MKIVIGEKVPPGVDFKAGQRLDLELVELQALEKGGVPWIAASDFDAAQREQTIKAEARNSAKAHAERSIKEAVVRAKSRDAIAAKDEVVQAEAIAKVEALDFRPEAVGLVVEKLDALKAKEDTTASHRITSSTAQGAVVESMSESGFKETIRNYIKASEPFEKEIRNGGIVRSTKSDPTRMKEIVDLSKERSILGARLTDMIAKGADCSASSLKEIVKAADYVDPGASNPLGTLNTGLLLQMNLGYLANQLAPIGDITTDISSQPVYYNQAVKTRYLIVPGVQLKSTTNAWTGGTGTDVDVNVTMDTHAGVPITINNNILGATPRQLFNEQRQPQLYGLGEYIIYKLAKNIFSGNSRVANDGTTTSTITFSNTPFSVVGSTLSTFVAALPEAMDELKFPGGDEQPGDPNLQRFAWVHGRVYAAAAQDTNFVLNQSIQAIRGNSTNGNVLETGRFERLGNIKFRKSQLITDQVAITGTGADGTTNAIKVSPGTFASATNVGFAGTRSSLLFVSRVPVDYTKVLADVPSTAAIELVTEPNTGLTFLVVKYLDHAYETANMRVQLMFGTAIGDERQGLLLKNA